MRSYARTRRAGHALSNVYGLHAQNRTETYAGGYTHWPAYQWWQSKWVWKNSLAASSVYCPINSHRPIHKQTGWCKWVTSCQLSNRKKILPDRVNPNAFPSPQFNARMEIVFSLEVSKYLYLITGVQLTWVCGTRMLRIQEHTQKRINCLNQLKLFV